MINRSTSELARAVFKSASGSLALRIAAMALGLVSNILLARAMGTAGYGAYAYLLAWVNFLYVPAMLGTDKLLVREVSIFNSQKKWGSLRGIVSWCGRWVTLSALFLAVVMVLAASSGLNDAKEISLNVLLVVSVLIPILALTGLRQSILQGLGAVVPGQIPETLIRPALLISAILVWKITSDGKLLLFDAITFNVGAALAAFSAGVLILKKRFPRDASISTPIVKGREWMTWSLPLLLLGFSLAGSAQLPMLVLGFFSSEHDIGLYAAAARVAVLGNFFLLALNAAFAPRIASLYASGQTEALQTLVSRTSLWVTILSLGPLLVFVFAGEYLLAVFGPEFSEASKMLTILAFGVFFNALMGSVGLLLTMTRNVKSALQAAIISLALNLLFSAILIPAYGAIGAAWATVGAYVVGNLILGFFVYTKIGIIPTFAALAIRSRKD